MKKVRRERRQQVGIGDKIKIRDGFEKYVKETEMNISDELKIIDGVEEADAGKTDIGNELWIIDGFEEEEKRKANIVDENTIIDGFGNNQEKAKIGVSDKIKIMEGSEEVEEDVVPHDFCLKVGVCLQDEKSISRQMHESEVQKKDLKAEVGRETLP